MFTIQNKQEEYVFITANQNEQQLAFPVNVFERAKKRNSRDIERNRVSVWIDDDPYIFSRKQWQQAKKRMAYQILRKIEEGIVISSVFDFVIMSYVDFENAKVIRDAACTSFNGNKHVDIFLDNVLYVFTKDQWSHADEIARQQQKSYAEILEDNKTEIHQKKTSCRRYLKRKQYRRK